jgi:hypothetical protein
MLDLLRLLLILYLKLGNCPLLRELFGLNAYTLLGYCFEFWISYEFSCVSSFMKGACVFFIVRTTPFSPYSLVDYLRLASLPLKPHLPMFTNCVVLLRLEPLWSNFLNMFGHEPRKSLTFYSPMFCELLFKLGLYFTGSYGWKVLEVGLTLNFWISSLIEFFFCLTMA